MNGKSTYVVKQTSYSQDKEAIVSLWLEGFRGMNEDRAQQRFLWMYKNNPAGEGLFFVLYDAQNKDVAGVQCLGMRNCSSSAGDLKSGIMADLVVGQKHRSLGPALQLVKGVIAQSSHAADILYGFPNKKAQLIFKRGGYKELGGMVRYAKVLRSNRYLSDRVPSWLSPLVAPAINSTLRLHSAATMLASKASVTGEWVEQFDTRFDHLWAENKHRFRMISNRSAATLNWRYGCGPDRENWKIFTISHNKVLLGYIVASLNNEAAVVSDFAFSGSTRNLFNLFSQFVWQASKHGCQSISLEFLGDQRLISRLGRLGFRPREEQPVYWMPFHEKLATFGVNDCYLTGFDRDT